MRWYRDCESGGLRSSDLGDGRGIEAEDVYPMRCGNMKDEQPDSHSGRPARTLRNSRSRPVSLVPCCLLGWAAQGPAPFDVLR